MKHFFAKMLGISSKDAVYADDFSLFFEAKSAEKAKVIREVMREATAEQNSVLERYRKQDSKEPLAVA